MGGKAARKGKEQPKNGNRYSSTVNTEIQVVENSEREMNTRMDDTTNYTLEEYKMLREEIKEKTGQINSISIQMIVSVAGLVGLGINMNIRVLFPVASFLCLFMYLRILYYNRAISRISAYMIVHLEPKMDIWWETSYYDKNTKDLFNNLLKGDGQKESKINAINAILKNNKRLNCVGFIEPVFLQLLCLGLWIAFSVRNGYFHFAKWLIVGSQIGVFVICIGAVVFLIWKDRDYHDGGKGGWIEIWKAYFIKGSESNKPKPEEPKTKNP